MLFLLLATAPDARAFDDQPWARVLEAHVDAQGRVDYAAIHAVGALDAWVEALATAPVPAAGDEATAFWINAYNAITVDLVADAWPIASIRDLDDGKVWTTRRVRVAGRELTLDQIEGGILRKQGDPRVHAALNCASKGCPALARVPYRAATLDRQLDEAARSWVLGGGVVVDQGAHQLRLCQIFDWYGEDFRPTVAVDLPGMEGHAEWAALFALPYLPADQAQAIRAGGLSSSWIPYDWGVNGR